MFYCKSCMKHFRNTAGFFPFLSFPFIFLLELIKPQQTESFSIGNTVIRLVQIMISLRMVSPFT